MENLPSRGLEHKGAYRSSLLLVHLAACSLWLAACGLQLAACGLWLVACGLWLVACGLWLVQLAACGLWLAACGLCSLQLAACGLWLVACDWNPGVGAHHLCREPAKTPTQSRQLFKQFQNPYIYSPQHGPEAYHPSRDGPTYREVHRPTSLAREHLREQLGIGYRERPLSTRQCRPNPPGPNSRLPPIRRRHLPLWPIAREGHSPGRQQSFLHHRGARLGSSNCLPDLALCPGGLAAGGAQAHPRLHCQHGCSRLGHTNPPDHPGHRGEGRGQTRQHLAKHPRRREGGSLLCCQDGRVGVAHSDAARRSPKTPAASCSERHVVVPGRLHAGLLGHPGPQSVGPTSRGGAPLRLPGASAAAKPARLHPGQHQFRRQPRLHFCIFYRHPRVFDQALQKVCRAYRGRRCAWDLWRPHVGHRSQYQPASSPDFGPPGRSGAWLHKAGDFHLRLPGGRAGRRKGGGHARACFANGDAGGGGFGHRPVRGAAPCQVVGVGLANPEDTPNRSGTPLLRLVGSARDGRSTKPLHPLHKGSRCPPSGARGRKPAYCAGPARPGTS